MSGTWTTPAGEDEGRVVGDGLRLRLIRPDDRLSEHSAYQRFFSAMKRLPID